MIRNVFSALFIALLITILPAQKRKMTDVQIMMVVLNNSHTKAVLRDSTLFIYIISGKTKISDYRECAEIANAKRLVVVTDKGIMEEKVKTTNP